MRIGCIMDPMEAVNVHGDTSFDWILAAQARGHEVIYIEPQDLVAENGKAFFWGRPVRVKRVQGDHYELGEKSYRPLADLDICWMRKDPPFEVEYLYSTYVLELADNAGDCWVLNRPSGLRDANEKAVILHFPELIPRTLVTHHAARILEFMEKEGGKCVVKPLDGHGGSEVFLLQAEDLNRNTILETITRLGTRYVMAQQFLPEASEGDKRIILVDGEPYGAILRVPKSGELRGNMHVGGKAIQAEVTERDREIIATIAPWLRERGLYFVGIDVIGGYLTEINVTSPTGIQEMSFYDNIKYSERFIAWQEEALQARKAQKS